MRLLLGCGDERREGWTRVDISPAAKPDVLLDLEVRPWPWPSDSAEEIEAQDVLEHLADTVGFMDEAWRVLARHGVLTLRVPNWMSPTAWEDPTHKRAFTDSTFGYFDDRTERGRTYGHLYTARRWRLLQQQVGELIWVQLTPVKGDHGQS